MHFWRLFSDRYWNLGSTQITPKYLQIEINLENFTSFERCQALQIWKMTILGPWKCYQSEKFLDRHAEPDEQDLNLDPILEEEMEFEEALS